MDIRDKEEELLRGCERKMLRRMFGAVHEDEKWRIKMNEELKRLFGNSYIVADIKLG